MLDGRRRYSTATRSGSLEQVTLGDDDRAVLILEREEQLR
jgi:hypothetical protein